MTILQQSTFLTSEWKKLPILIAFAVMPPTWCKSQWFDLSEGMSEFSPAK
jgi:hypothetical protein